MLGIEANDALFRGSKLFEVNSTMQFCPELGELLPSVSDKPTSVNSLSYTHPASTLFRPGNPSLSNLTQFTILSLQCNPKQCYTGLSHLNETFHGFRVKLPVTGCLEQATSCCCLRHDIASECDGQVVEGETES